MVQPNSIITWFLKIHTPKARSQTSKNGYKSIIHKGFLVIFDFLFLRQSLTVQFRLVWNCRSFCLILLCARLRHTSPHLPSFWILFFNKLLLKADSVDSGSPQRTLISKIPLTLMVWVNGYETWSIAYFFSNGYGWFEPFPYLSLWTKCVTRSPDGDNWMWYMQISGQPVSTVLWAKV
jgi:hypothetical protein